MRPDFVGLGGFDSHTFPPRVFTALLAIVLPASSGLGQAVGAKPPITPGHAFFTSLAVPGLAQARLERSTGMFFAAIEVASLTMLAKSKHDLAVAQAFVKDSTPATYATDAFTGLARRDSTGAFVVQTWTKAGYDSARVHARKVHVEDWVATLIFNHLFAGVDAFVAAQLWELPGQVQMRATPHGGTIQAKFRW